MEKSKSHHRVKTEIARPQNKKENSSFIDIVSQEAEKSVME
jgi:hypothetical protein